MSSMIFPYIWCILQVALISVISMVVSHVVIRRYPALAAGATASGAITILLVTALVPAPLPHLSLPQAAGRAIGEQAASESGMPLTSKSSSIPVSTDALPPLFDFRTVLSSLFHFTDGNTGSSHLDYFMVRGLTMIAAGFILLGLLRLIGALRYVARLKRHSSAVVDRNANQLLARLARQLSVNTPVALRETIEIESAAVVGWRKPVIILPIDWKDWTADQLRAVLAHELAHVVRGDAAWRLAASLARAVHFYHPLMHWLAGQLALAQELAADRLAAEVFADRGKYLKALSQLAIRKDDGSRLQAEPLVLPALSTNLIRRIKMLKAKDCNHERRLPYGLRCMLVGFIVLVGAVTMALRSSAEQPPADQSAKGAERASQPSEVDKEPKPQAPFGRAPLDISLVGDNEFGVFAIRMAELSRRLELKPLFTLANNAINEIIIDRLKAETSPEIRLESIDHIAGQLKVTIKRLKDVKNEKENNALMIGTGEVVIRFHDKVRWKEWLTRFIPGAEEKKEGDLVYFECLLPAFGPTPLLISARDEQTIVWAQDLDRLRKMADKNVAHRVKPAVASEWDAAGGGLITMVFTDKNMESNIPSPNDPREISIYKIIENTSNFSLGYDIQEGTNDLVVKFSLVCEDEKSANQVKEAIDRLIPLAIEQAEEEAGESAENRFYKKLLENSSTSVVKRGVKSFAVVIECTAALPLKEIAVAMAADSDGAVTK